eukprot:38811-Eustigmatos_ZCMA.PRE.1
MDGAQWSPFQHQHLHHRGLQGRVRPMRPTLPCVAHATSTWLHAPHTRGDSITFNQVLFIRVERAYPGFHADCSPRVNVYLQTYVYRVPDVAYVMVAGVM